MSSLLVCDDIHSTLNLCYRVEGGSTIVCLFEKNVVEWDEDLLINGRAALETLVRVGMGIGRLRGSPAPLADIGRNGSG